MSSFIAFRAAAFSLLRPKPCQNPSFHHQQRRTAKKVAAAVPPRDEDIEQPVVQIVDSAGRLTIPLSLKGILDSIDKKCSFVQLIKTDPPLVKIISKKMIFDKERVEKARARVSAKKNTHKEVQLTWGANSADQAHKIERMRMELEKGSRVDLVIAHKKKQVLPKPAEMRERVQEMVDSLADVSKEWKDREVRATITAVFLQGLGGSSQDK